MAQSLDKFFQTKVKMMPPVEMVMTPDQLRKPPNKKAQAPRTKKILPPGTYDYSSDVDVKQSPSSIAGMQLHSVEFTEIYSHFL